MMLSNFPVLTLSSPGAVAFYIGVWPIRWYGVLIAVSFLIAYFLAESLIKKADLSIAHFSDMIFLILIFSIIFARLYFVFLSWDYFKDHWNEIPKIWHGGQSIHGGIFGAVLAALIFARLKKISFYKYIDVIAVVMPLGQSIGRWGNFFNNEAFGKPIESGLSRLYWPIRLNIPYEFRPSQYLNTEYFHPTFLYESFLDFALFVYLFKMFPVWKKKPGKTFWTYLFCYSVIRFFLEFLRVDSLNLFGNIASAHILSVIIFVISLNFLIKR
ncbi:MAG: prolipoprotein diacylglyceryl transferase [Candidatus Melainabacteria bacterium]|nr:prolipoprotein diacylglyceryl transferase [Candidatus Melainabacteria bacterium]